MKILEINELSIRQYLLGQLRLEEVEQLEERLFTDPDFYEQLTLVEDELIDAYARGSLPQQERGKFEELFLSNPERRRKLRFARNFKKYIESETATSHASDTRTRRAHTRWASLIDIFNPRNFAVSLSLAALMVVILLGVSWTVFKFRRDENKPLQAQTQLSPQPNQSVQPTPVDPSPNSSVPSDSSTGANTITNSQPFVPERTTNSNLTNERAKPRKSNFNSLRSTSVYAINLLAPSIRETNTAESFKIPSSAKRVLLSVSLEADAHQSYRVVIQNVDSGKKITRGGLKALSGGTEKRVVLDVAAASLKRGDYILQLSGVVANQEVEDIRSYYFRINNR